MAHPSMLFLLLVSLASVGLSDRVKLEGAVCSIVEKTEGDHAHTQYGVQFAFKTNGDCTSALCNVYQMNSGIRSAFSSSQDAKGKCTCSGDGKFLFRSGLAKDQSCNVDFCWQKYGTIMNIIKRKSGGLGRPITWLTSLNHYEASCDAGASHIPSLEEAIQAAKDKNPEIVVENMVGGDTDMKEDDGPMYDDFEDDDDQLDGEDEGEAEAEEALCPDLAKVVTADESRVRLEKEDMAEYETIISDYEMEVDKGINKAAEYEKQFKGFKGFYETIVSEKGGRVCSITEDKSDPVQFGVSFAYTMQNTCNSVKCNVNVFMNSQRDKIITHEFADATKTCACKMDGRPLFNFHPSKLYSCSNKGCWSFYSSIRNLAERKLTGKFPLTGNWLDSHNHWKAECKEGAENKAQSVIDLAEELKENGHADVLADLLKNVVVEKSVEERLTEKTVVAESGVDLANQKEKCPELAKKLALIKKELLDHQEINKDKMELAQDLESKIAESKAKIQAITKQIHAVAGKLSAAEKEEVPAGPVTF